MKYRRLISYMIAAAMLSAAVAGCAAQDSGAADATGQQPTVSTSTVDEGAAEKIDALADAPETRISLADDATQIDGEGAEAEGGAITITAAGIYRLSGALTDGQVVVDAGKEDTVRLILDGVSITSGGSAGIYGKKAGLLQIVLADGSENTVTDAAAYTYADAEAQEPDAAIFSKNDLHISGGGSLTVNGNFNNGIGTKDNLVIEGGDYNVGAVNHGIRGRDSITVADGGFVIRSGNDGINANNDGEGKGWILLEGGSYDIAAGHDGIQAQGGLRITGGDYAIVTAGGSAAQGLSADESYKGLKAGGSIAVEGGVFAIDSADDAVHSNADIAITGGAFAIQTGDDGVHADGHLEISGGEIDITRSYEGLEAMTMTLAGGRISVRATDDGINIAGGNDSGGGRFGGDMFADTGERWLSVTGGDITVDADGDGIDVNGSWTMSGGTVLVHGPTHGGDAPIDFDGAFTLTGGVLLAAGSSGMAQVPGDDSTQASLAVVFTAMQEGGAIALTGADGGEIAAFAPAKSYQFVLISAPELRDGETYTLSQAGAVLTDVTLSGAVTAISETGEAATLRMGGMGGFGGRGGGMPGGEALRDLPEGGGPGRDGAPGGGRRPGGESGVQ